MFVRIPLPGDDPLEGGLSVADADKLVAAVRSRFPLDDSSQELSRLDKVMGGCYFLRVPDGHQLQALVKYLQTRNYDHEVLEQLPQPKPPQPQSPPQDSTVGIIFFFLDSEQITPAAAKGVVHGIAALLHEMSRGEFRLRANFIRDEKPQSYWVAFNDEGAGLIFAYTMREKGLQVPHARALPNGQRPELKVVDYDQTAQLAADVAKTTHSRRERKRREDLREPDLPQDEAALATGRGFAVVRKLFLNSPLVKKMEERYSSRQRIIKRRGE